MKNDETAGMKYEITAKRLRMALIERNISQQVLADASGVSKASISQYVNGRNTPASHNARRLSAILGVRPEWLMGFGDDNIEQYVDPTYSIINQLWGELTYEQRVTLTRTAQMFAELNNKMDGGDEDETS